MKENKNIDRLFQEQFKNLDINPNEEVWENIELRLREKKKKRVVPFWWKLSGVAAVLVVGLGIYNFAIDNNKVSNDIVIDSNVEKNNAVNPNEVNKLENNEVVSSDSDVVKNNTNPLKIKNVEINPIVNSGSKNNTPIANNSDEAIIGRNTISNENKNRKNNSALNSSSKTNTAVANNSEENNNTVNNSSINRNSKTNNVASKKSDDNKKGAKNSDFTTTAKNNNSVANNLDSKKSETEKLNKNIDPSKPINNTPIIAEITNSELKKDEVKKIDSTSIASVVPNAMEELLNEKEKKTSKEPKLNRWQLSSNVAPIYFSSTSNGSPLDSELKNNSKTYKTNFSYGLGVNYAVNKKIKLRTGVNTVSLNYDTNDVVIYQNVNAKTLDHVKPNSIGSFLQIESKNSSNATANQEIASSGNILKKFNSVVNQQIGYLEIPLEMSYKVLDKKFGVDVIGGFSTLLLNQNEVSVISSGVEMNIGEANNLNDIHFSTNVGVGFKYSFMKNFEARVEPVFKYQINTFISDSGDFKPYFFGLYSGITFTF
jgi:hypothetical protein